MTGQQNQHYTEKKDWHRAWQIQEAKQRALQGTSHSGTESTGNYKTRQVMAEQKNAFFFQQEQQQVGD